MQGWNCDVSKDVLIIERNIHSPEQRGFLDLESTKRQFNQCEIHKIDIRGDQYEDFDISDLEHTNQITALTLGNVTVAPEQLYHAGVTLLTIIDCRFGDQQLFSEIAQHETLRHSLRQFSVIMCKQIDYPSLGNYLDHLDSLEIVDSDLETIEFTSQTLRTLSLYQCTKLQLIDDVICPQLESLNISRTSVVFLDRLAQNFPKLQSIDASFCSKLNSTQDLSRLPPMKVVNLSNTPVSSLALPNVCEADVSYTRLKTFSEFQKASTILAQGCNISTLNGLQGNDKLQILDCTECKHLTSLYGLRESPQLKRLLLAESGLTRLDAGWAKHMGVPALDVLDLSQTSVPAEQLLSFCQIVRPRTLLFNQTRGSPSQFQCLLKIQCEHLSVRDSVYFETQNIETQDTDAQKQSSTQTMSLDLTNTAIQSLTELQPYKFRDLTLLNFAEKHVAQNCRISVTGELTLDPDTDVTEFDDYRRLCIKYKDCADLSNPVFDLSRVRPKQTLVQLRLYNLQQVINVDQIQELTSLQQLEIVNCQLEQNILPRIPQTVQHLALCQNRLTTCSGIERLTALKYLDISYNEMDLGKSNYNSFSQQFARLTQLQVLNVSNNPIKSVANLLKHLEHYLPLTVSELYVKKQAQKNCLTESGELLLRKRVQLLKEQLEQKQNQRAQLLKEYRDQENENANTIILLRRGIRALSSYGTQ